MTPPSASPPGPPPVLPCQGGPPVHFFELLGEDYAWRALEGAGLTTREEQVAMLLLAGEPYKNIAYELGVPPGTASSLARSVYRKLGVAGRSGLTAWCMFHAMFLLAGDCVQMRRQADAETQVAKP